METLVISFYRSKGPPQQYDHHPPHVQTLVRFASCGRLGEKSFGQQAAIDRLKQRSGPYKLWHA